MSHLFQILAFCVFINLSVEVPVRIPYTDGLDNYVDYHNGDKTELDTNLKYGTVSDNAQPGLVSNDKERHNDGVPSFRPKRSQSSYMTDHGYGSRLVAGQNMAKDMSIYGDVYGKFGPGKRATGNSLTKRYITDHGYGSRVHAGDKLSKSLWAKESVYGHYGPGKRNWWPYKRIVTDNGYGSRIETGSQLARDVVAVGDLFGRYGPGRRKRTEDGQMEQSELPDVFVVLDDDQQ